jgi:hypothetical protein
MEKYLVVAVLVLASATPALAADFYIAADRASGKCMVMASTPNAGQFKTMGQYRSRTAAHRAMHGMKDCK